MKMTVSQNEKPVEPESIVMCIKAGEGQCCIGRECPLYKECFSKGK